MRVLLKNLLILIFALPCYGTYYFADPIYGVDTNTGKATVPLVMTNGSTSGSTLTFTNIGDFVFPADILYMTSATSPAKAGQYRVLESWGQSAVTIEKVSGDALVDRSDWAAVSTDGPVSTFAKLDTLGTSADSRVWVMESEINGDDGTNYGSGTVVDLVLTDDTKAWGDNGRNTYHCVISGKHYYVADSTNTTLTLNGSPPPGACSYYLVVNSTHRYLSFRKRLVEDTTRPIYRTFDGTGYTLRWVSSQADGTGDGTTSSITAEDPHMAWTFQQAIESVATKSLVRVMDDGVYNLTAAMVAANSGTTGPILFVGYANQNGTSPFGERPFLNFGPVAYVDNAAKTRWVFEHLLFANGADDRTATLYATENTMVYDCEFSTWQSGAVQGVTPRIYACWFHHPGATAIQFASTSATAGAFGQVMFCRFSEPQEKVIDSSSGPLVIMYNEFSNGEAAVASVTNSASNGLLMFNTFNGGRTVCTAHGRFDAFNIFVNNWSGTASYTNAGGGSCVVFENVFWNNDDMNIAGTSSFQPGNRVVDPGIAMPLNPFYGGTDRMNVGANMFTSPFDCFGVPQDLTCGSFPIKYSGGTDPYMRPLRGPR